MSAGNVSSGLEGNPDHGDVVQKGTVQADQDQKGVVQESPMEEDMGR